MKSPDQKPLTKQRKAVLHAIHSSDQHLTANEVFLRAVRELPTISFATVYNSLRYLREAGMISEVSIGPGPVRYDRITDSHHHSVCEVCGELGDVALELPAELVKEAVEKFGFDTHKVEITIRGECPKCLKLNN